MTTSPSEPLHVGDQINLDEVKEYTVIAINKIARTVQLEFQYRGRTCRAWAPMDRYEVIPEVH